MDSFYAEEQLKQRPIIEELQAIPSAVYRRAILGVILLAGIIATSGCASSRDISDNFPAETAQSNTIVTGRQGSMDYNGRSVSTVTSRTAGTGVVVASGSDGMAVITGDEPVAPNESYIDARELKLKIRELGEQLIAESTDPYLRSAIAMPTSFVSLNNFNTSSAFGQLVSEQLIYEFNQRGFPIREYRLDASITVNRGGEFYLSREHLQRITVNSPGAVVLVGTYQEDLQAVFVNARLVRPGDGKILRTGNLVLNANPLVKRLLRKKTGSIHLQGAAIPIKQRSSGSSGSGRPGDGSLLQPDRNISIY